MNDNRLKIERILLLVAALVLCAFLAVRVTLAWLSANTSRMAVVTGDADLDVTFYRLRDFNRDGKYDYNDYYNDLKDPVRSATQNFLDFTKRLNAHLAAGETAITAENFDQTLAALAKAEDVTEYVYTTDFTSVVDNVNMGSYVTYRVRVKNNSARAAEAALSFGNLMRYYYNTAQMEYYLAHKEDNKKIDPAIGGADGDNIENYAAKFLFSVEVLDGAGLTKQLWEVAQSETFAAMTVGAAGAADGADTADLDFRLAFDGKSVAADYLKNYVTNTDGECYRECLNIAQGMTGVTDPAGFTAEYLHAVYDAEMTYLFSSSEGGGVAPNVNLKLDYVQITGTLQGQAVTQ